MPLNYNYSSLRRLSMVLVVPSSLSLAQEAGRTEPSSLTRVFCLPVFLARLLVYVAAGDRHLHLLFGFFFAIRFFQRNS